MSADVVSLRGGPIEDDCLVSLDAVIEIRAALADLHDRCGRGEIAGFAFVAVGPTGTPFTGHFGEASPLELLGAARLLDLHITAEFGAEDGGDAA